MSGFCERQFALLKGGAGQRYGMGGGGQGLCDLFRRCHQAQERAGQSIGYLICFQKCRVNACHSLCFRPRRGQFLHVLGLSEAGALPGGQFLQMLGISEAGGLLGGQFIQMLGLSGAGGSAGRPIATNVGPLRGRGLCWTANCYKC